MSQTFKNTFKGPKKSSLIIFLLKSLLWEENLSQFWPYFFFLLSNFHLLLILFWLQLDLLAQENQENLLYRTVSRISVRLFWDADDKTEASIRAFFIGISCYFGVAILGLCRIVYLFVFQTSVSRTISLMITFFGQFHIAFGFWVINMRFIDYLAFYLWEENYLEFIIINKASICLGFFLIILNYLIGFVFSLYSFDPFLSSNGLSSHSPLFQASTFIIKALLCLVILFQNSTARSWVLVSISLATTCLRHYQLFKVFPYYHYRAMAISSILSSISVLIAVTSFLTLFLRTVDVETISILAYFQLLLIPLVGKFAVCYLYNTTIRNLILNKNGFESKEKILKNIFALTFIMNNAKLIANNHVNKQKSELYFFGVLENNSNLNRFQANRPSFGEEGIHKEKICEFKDICDYYSQAINTIRKNVLVEYLERSSKRSEDFIKVLVADLTLKIESSGLSSILLLEDYQNLTGNAHVVSFKLVEKLQKVIERFFSENNDHIFDLKTFIKFEYESTNFIKMIHLNTNKYIEFWDTFSAGKFKIIDLFRKSQQIEKEFDQIQNIWKRHTGDNHLVASSLSSIYSVYLTLARNAPSFANKLIGKPFLNRVMSKDENFNNSLSTENLIDPNVIVFCGSMTGKDYGKVTYVSANIAEHLSWNQNEIVGHKIKAFLPLFMREKHDQMILDHLNTCKLGLLPARMYNTKNSFILHKSGATIPCDVYISIHPEIQETPTYVVITRMKKNPIDFIIIDKDGWVQGFSSNSVANSLGILSNKENNIKDFCVNFGELEKKLNEENEGNEQIELRNSLQNQNTRKAKEKKVSEVKLDFLVPYSQSQSNQNEKRQQYNINIEKYKFSGENFFILNFLQKAVIQNAYIHENQKLVNKEISQLPLNFDEELPCESQSSPIPNLLISAGNDRCIFSKVTDLNSIDKKKGSYETISHPTGSYVFSKNFLKVKSDKEIDTSPNPGVQIRDSVCLLTKQYGEDMISKMTKIDLQGTKDVSNHYNNDVLIKSAETDTLEQRKSNPEAFFVKSGLIDKKRANETLEKGIVENIKEKSSIENFSFNRSMMKLEKTVNTTPDYRSLNIYNILLYLFIIIVLATLFAFQLQNHQVLNWIQTCVQAMSISVFRLLRFTDLGQYVRNLWQLELDLYTDNRYAVVGVPINFTEVVRDQISEIIINLNQQNTYLRLFVDQMDFKLQSELYERKIPVYEMDSQGIVKTERAANSFDLISDLISQGTKLLTSGLQINEKNPYLLFCLNNTFNELLVSSEEMLPILFEYTKDKLATQDQYILISLICIAATGTALLVFMYIIIRNFIVNRDKFLRILLRIDKQKINLNSEKVKRFAFFLEEYGFNPIKISSKIVNKNFDPERQLNKKLENSKSEEHASDWDHLNTTLYTLFVTTILFTILLFSAFPVILIVTQLQNSMVIKRMELKTQANFNLFNPTLLMNMIYVYVQENGVSRLRNKPLIEEWNNIFEKAADFQDFLLIDLMDEDKGLGYNPKLYALIMGSLCDNLEISDVNLAKKCKTIGDGVMERGVIGINSYTLAAIKLVKEFFDNSDKSRESIKEAFLILNLINAELIYPLIYQVYVWIDNLLWSQLSESFDESRNFISIINTVYSIISILIGGIVWRSIKEKIKKEMYDWRRMIKQIPLMVIKENKMLKIYISKTSNGYLTRNMN